MNSKNLSRSKSDAILVGSRMSVRNNNLKMNPVLTDEMKHRDAQNPEAILIRKSDLKRMKDIIGHTLREESTIKNEIINHDGSNKPQDNQYQEQLNEKCEQCIQREKYDQEESMQRDSIEQQKEQMTKMDDKMSSSTSEKSRKMSKTTLALGREKSKVIEKNESTGPTISDRVIEDQNPPLMAAGLPTDGDSKVRYVLSRTQEIRNDQFDDVKEMDKMVTYAKCATIREQQLAEKQQLAEERKQAEKRKDMMMEMERLKKIKFYEEIEQRRKEQLREGTQQIASQIQENELARQQKKIDRQREGRQMVEAVQQLEIEEQEKARKKKQQQQLILSDIYDANKVSTLIKSKRADEEKLIDLKIAQYNLEKERREAEVAAEQRRMKELQEKEILRLCKKQEKDNGKQAELQAERLKLALDASEQNKKDRENREIEFRERVYSSMQEARKQQQLDKEKQKQERARKDQHEAQQLNEMQSQQRDFEMKQRQDRYNEARKNADILREQIAQKESKQRFEQQKKLEEGRKMHEDLVEQKRILEGIKQSKLEQMHQLSIPDKFMSDLQRMKITID